MKIGTVVKIQNKAMAFLNRAGIVITPGEHKSIEVADFGLDDVNTIGIELVVYQNNDRYCAKELIMFPRQICPEHRHPPLSRQNVGKQETFRCRWGEVYLYVEGTRTRKPRAVVPEKYRKSFTVWHEIVLLPGEQYTIKPNTLHWFQSGDEGAIVSEFSSSSDDASDVFTDPNVQRIPVIES